MSSPVTRLAAYTVFAIAFTSCAAWGGSEGDPAQAERELLTLEQAITRALDNNMDVRLARADVLAAEAGWTGASLRSRFNPEIEVVSGTRTSDGDPVDLELAVSQEVEVAGQRGHRRSVAEAILKAKQARLEHVRSSVITETHAAFIDVLATREKGRLAEEAVRLGRRLNEAADRQFEAGTITVLERNLARVRLGQARRSRLSAERRHAESLTALRGLLALPAGGELGVIGELAFERGPVPHVDVLVELAREHRADLRALRQARVAADAELLLARSEGRPNLHFGLGWERDDGAEDFLLGFGVTIPVFNRNQGGIAAGHAHLERASVELASADLAVARDVEQARQHLVSASEDLDIFDEEVLSQVEDNLELLQESFDVGKVSLLQLLPLQRELVELREAHVEAVSAAIDARTRLWLATGVEVGFEAGELQPVKSLLSAGRP